MQIYSFGVIIASIISVIISNKYNSVIIDVNLQLLLIVSLLLNKYNTVIISYRKDKLSVIIAKYIFDVIIAYNRSLI